MLRCAAAPSGSVHTPTCVAPEPLSYRSRVRSPPAWREEASRRWTATPLPCRREDVKGWKENMSVGSVLRRLGPMEGKTERDFADALGPPVAIHNMAHGR